MKHRHCEERSDEAIQPERRPARYYSIAPLIAVLLDCRAALRRLAMTSFFFIFLVTPVFAFDPCSSDAASHYSSIQERYLTGVLFRVEKCGSPASYVMGTMHSDSPSLLTIYNKAAAVLATSQLGIFEIVLNPSTVQKAQAAMFYPEGSAITLEEKLGKEYFTRFVQAMNDVSPLPAQAYLRLKPWAGAILLETPKNEADGVVLDDKLQRFAAQRGIPLAGLETAEEQFSVFSSLPEEQQLAMLKDAVDNRSISQAMNKALIEAYQKEDLQTITALGESAFESITDASLRTYIKDKLLIERNHTMVQRMQARLARGGAFVGIGALHLMGESGVLLQLEQKGYFITPVQ